MWKKLFCLILFFSACRPSYSIPDVLLPYPQKADFSGETFLFDALDIIADDSLILIGNTWLQSVYAGKGRGMKHHVHIKCTTLDDVPMNKEQAYKLKVTSSGVAVEAETRKGVFNAIQTLRQLSWEDEDGIHIRGCEIVDWPAFKIRGFLMDVGRRYVSLDELKREIAVLSMYKVNVFHWHLTENQAWRLESKLYPALNDSVNVTRMPGKYYTLDEAKELVAFCQEHNVMLIPEIDMPGHSEAFVRTFGCSMQSAEGMAILKRLMDEFCETFDVPYIHIGTDEVNFTNPEFVPEMVAYIRAKGRKVISWNPGWQYQPGEIDMTQLWSYRGKAQEGIPAIDCRFHYVNHFDTFGDIIALYNSRIYDRPDDSDGIVGSILAVWNDRFVESEKNVVLDNHLYPNMLALAERAWRGGGSEYFNVNGTILPADTLSEVFREFADFERRMLWHKRQYFGDLPFGYVRQTNVRWHITDAFPNGGELDQVFPPEQSLEDKYTYGGKTYHVRPAIGAGIYLRHVWGTFVPGFYQNPEENHTAYAYTYVYSPKQQEVGLWVEFQNYSRSEKDLPPPQGKWDYKGSRIWLNESEILPPVWTATHTVSSNEVALGNENCVTRDPMHVILQKGWNKVLLKLPVGRFTTSEVRLVKWMFTTVFVTLDGQDAVEGLVYSPVKSFN